MVLPRNAEATRQRLFDAALELYSQRGYAGTCLDAILRLASSSKGAFYHHFDSKEELTARALELHWHEVIDALELVWQSELDREKRLDRLLEALKLMYTSTQNSCPLGLLGFESCSLPPGVQRTLAAGLELWTERLAAMLADLGIGQAEARNLARQLFVTFEGGILIERMSGLPRGLEPALASWRREVIGALARLETARGASIAASAARERRLLG